MSQFEREGKTMGIIDKSKLRGKAGFSLLELMVVVAILGVLATVAVPRFNVFRTRARQGEAKSNLGLIYTLQEAFLIDHEEYFDGNGTVWGGQMMNSWTDSVGYRGGGNRVCTENKLGFRLANCDSARYGYFIPGGDELHFMAIAYAASDQTGDERVYPGCNGVSTNAAVNNSRGANYARPTKVQDIQCRATGGQTNYAATTFASGDAWCLEERRRLENYRDIVEFCEDN